MIGESPDLRSLHGELKSIPCIIIAFIPGSPSDLKNRSEKVTGGGEIMGNLKAKSYSIGRKSSEI
jgi:hypothetical protein